jgi:hypothetical protein
MNEEKHKYQSSVRQLILYRKQMGLREFREYMNKYREKLPWQLIRDFEDQWTKGNRGEKGEWK